ANWSEASESAKIGFDPLKKEKSMGGRPYQGEKSRKMMKRSKGIEARRNAAVEEKSSLLKNIESADTSLHFKALKHPKQLLVECNDLAIFYDALPVFAHLNFTIRQGDRCVLRGRNGCGKSSVIQLILGEALKHTGQLSRASNLKISYVPQNTAGLSGTLNEFALQHGLDESLFKAILRKMDFQRTQFEKSIDEFSEGQKKKVWIAKSLCEEAHLFIWDEPLNYVDVISRMQIEELLLSFPATILFVEHDIAFNENVATKVIDLDQLRE
ncbi:MAG: ATP-binding cassette domain-containing protein, partial [Oscillospiraceae bacterium]